MPRQRKDGRPLPKKQVVKLTAKFVESLKPGPDRQTFYDSKLAGFALRVEPSGARAFKLTYRHRKRPRWYNLGAVGLYPGEEGMKIVRTKCLELKLRMAKDETFDPQANRVSERSDGTFAQDLEAYLAHCAKTLKAPEQKAQLLRSVFLGAWETLPTKGIVKADVRHVLEKCQRAANSRQLAKTHLSAFFNWARERDLYLLDNPCASLRVEDAKINEGDRILTVDEMPMFWEALKVLDPNWALALKLVLLTGARGGEVLRMRHEHIKLETIKLPKKQRDRLRRAGQDVPESVTGFCWVQPGKPDAAWKKDERAGVPERKRLGWDGTKNSQDHRYWLPQPVVDLIQGGSNVTFLAGRTGPLFPRWRDLSKEMKKVCAAMGLEPDNGISTHDLRRTFSDTIGWAGFPDEAMHRILNHKPSRLTKTYSPTQKLEEAWEISNAVVAELLERAAASTLKTTSIQSP